MIKKCQVFTPKKQIEVMLDEVLYNKNIYGKKILENSCGDGKILVEIVKRYIEDSINKNISIETIKVGLERDIWGFEIDSTHYKNCLKNLDDIANEFNLENVTWSVVNEDFLKYRINEKFDYVVGNPPYINYRDLSVESRKYLKESYVTCKKGKFDYYYAFIEKSLGLLTDGGKMSYLVPNTVLKNVFAELTREMIKDNLTKIIDYKTIKMFSGVLTSSILLVIDKTKKTEKIEYLYFAERSKVKINKSNLNDEKWIFEDIKQSKINRNKKRFGDYFSASMGVATLLNKAFIIKDPIELKRHVMYEGIKIKKEILKLAASPKNLERDNVEYIIYPYKYNGNKLEKYDEIEFEKSFQGANDHLKKYIEELKRRKSDKGSRWFEFGRGQAINHMNQEKLLLSSVITKKVRITKLGVDEIPYAGIYIVPKRDMTLDCAMEILNSFEFYDYILNVGTNLSGNSIRISSKDINNYMF